MYKVALSNSLIEPQAIIVCDTLEDVKNTMEKWGTKFAIIHSYIKNVLVEIDYKMFSEVKGKYVTYKKYTK